MIVSIIVIHDIPRHFSSIIFQSAFILSNLPFSAFSIAFGAKKGGGFTPPPYVLEN
jgi:hypothetical protein